MFRLDGKVALVTGGGSGIGEQIALLFARQGAAVVIGDVDEWGGERVAAAIVQAGGQSRYQRLDVAQAGSAEDAVRACVETFGGLHVLINNAGVSYVGDVLETDESEYDRVMSVNVKGVYLCARAAIAHMVEHGGGSVVNMASVAGMVGIKRRFVYGATKGAVIAMTKSMAIDLVDRHVRVNCICPGTVHTPFVDGYLDRFHSHNRDETLAGLHARQPIGRMGRPEEIAYAALYLASDEASFATGTALVVDGGLTAQ
jgi:2-keto-3-deoxy-L-fuconate dehydrogenase